jgi:hypothetical protein
MIKIVASIFVASWLWSTGMPSAAAVLVPGPLREFAPGKSAQSLLVYDVGAGGQYTGEYARYRTSDLALLEWSSATGVGSPPVFDGNGLPAWTDEATSGGFGVFEQPAGSKSVPGDQLFPGIPCQSSSLAVGPTGDFYAVQYCSGNVLKYSAGKSTKAKKPLAIFTGGNIGGSGQPDPTVAAVDPAGDLYVGDYEGGVTYFKAGSTKASVALPFGVSQSTTQIFIDANGDAWATHLGNPTIYYFKNEKQCVLDPQGTVSRSEVAEHFSKGKLVAHLYTAPTGTQFATDQGESIALDKNGVVYIGADAVDEPSAVLAYDSGASCPDTNRSVLLEHAADPQVGVDATGRHYVSDYASNMLAVYASGGTKPLKAVAQPTGFVNPAHLTVGP